jgi:nucleoside-diphosphate-sugar epimerase
MRLFVTGASGFIGSELCKQAEAARHQVLRLEKPSRLNDPPVDLIASFKPEVAVHCAWIATPGVYIDSPENEVFRSQSLELFRVLSLHGLRHFVGCGTCAEYAPSRFALDEDTSVTAPSSIYAKAKHALHADLRKAASGSTVTLTWARIFFPYGPEEHPDRLVSTLFRALQAGEREHLRFPAAVRDYIHVQDVAAALLTCAISHADGCYNIGMGSGISLGKLEAEVARLCGWPDLPAAETCPEARRTEDCFVASVRKLQGLGWKPRYRLSDGLATYRRSTSS